MIILWLLEKLVYQRCRKIDLEVLWPQIKSISDDIGQARCAFAAHAFNSNAWRSMGLPALFRFLSDLR
jgi:hypothetical protein